MPWNTFVTLFTEKCVGGFGRPGALAGAYSRN
jgi:hypothetical protein